MARTANSIKNPYGAATEGKQPPVANYEKSSASLLAEQPGDPKEESPPSKYINEWKQLQSHLEQRLNGLRTWRTSWWFQNWSDLAQYIEPRRSTWLTQGTGGWPTPNSNTRGRQINNSIVDPTATYAVRVCSSGLMSGLASPSRPWFKIVPSVKGVEIDADGRAWLDEVEDRIYTILAGSNFYNSFAQECEDLVVFGTGPSIIYEDEKDIIRCYNPAVGEYFLGASATNRVDTLNRAFVMTVSQIVDFFGAENCTAEIQKLWMQKGTALEREFIIAHSIEPNFGIGKDEIGKVKGPFAWREVYWVYGSGSENPLSMRGFVEQPFTAGRWSTLANDAYGRSVGMDVLPDVVQLNLETLRKAEAIEKQVRPPLIASMDMKNQPSSILPGAVSYSQNIATSGMKPIYTVNPDIRGLMEDLKEIQERIKKGFLNDIMLPLLTNPGDRRTAYETAQMVVEKLSQAGPVIENIITESLKPKLKRIFGICKRRNILPPPPKSMQGVPIDIDFVSMLALASRGASTAGLERIASFTGNLTAVYPEAKDNINVDMLINEMSRLLDNPQKIMRSANEVSQVRQAQAQQLKQAQDAKQMSQGVQDVKTGAEAASVLASTNVGSGASVLDRMIGTGQTK